MRFPRIAHFTRLRLKSLGLDTFFALIFNHPRRLTDRFGVIKRGLQRRWGSLPRSFFRPFFAAR
jgi:hypothetical protein